MHSQTGNMQNLHAHTESIFKASHLHSVPSSESAENGWKRQEDCFFLTACWKPFVNLLFIKLKQAPELHRQQLHGNFRRGVAH